MSKPQCRFCGSSNLTDAIKIWKKTNTNQLKLELSYELIKVSAGSITRKKEFEIGYPTTLCNLCRNTDAINEINPSPPLEAYNSDFRKWVVIPNILSTHLKSVKYDEGEMLKLLSCIRNCLEKIYNKWSVDGLNPCKSEHMGKKITIPLKHGVGIMCWVIVESIKNKTYLRLSYGGNKITCPES